MTASVAASIRIARGGLHLNLSRLSPVFTGLHRALCGRDSAAVLLARERPALPLLHQLSSQHQCACAVSFERLGADPCFSLFRQQGHWESVFPGVVPGGRFLWLGQSSDAVDEGKGSLSSLGWPL